MACVLQISCMGVLLLLYYVCVIIVDLSYYCVYFFLFTFLRTQTRCPEEKHEKERKTKQKKEMNRGASTASLGITQMS